ncbi:MAG TPA: hypothetical protein VGJ28_20705 [Micromonosporaceae bacterium]
MSHPDLVTVASVLGDGEAGATSSTSGAKAPGTYTVVPSASSPRLLVPHGQRRVAAAAVRGSIVAVSRQARLRQQALAGLFAIGIGRASLGDLIFRGRVTVDSSSKLSTFLSTQLGTRVHVSMRFGPQRANRKPVLQLLDQDGRCIAFAKLSVDEITEQLILAETAALRGLDGSDLSPVRAPRVRYAGPWGNAALLVVEALPVWSKATVPPARAAELRAAAMRAVASSAGVTRTTVASSGYVARLGERVDALGDHPLTGTFRDAIAAASKHPEPIDFGAWHGDWNAGNMAVRGDDVLLWDWERYTIGAPVGFDALHYELFRSVGTGTSAVEAAAGIAARRAAILAPLGIAAGDADPVWTLYATDIATRFVTDRQELGTTRLAQVSQWIGPALADVVPAAQRS